MAGIWDTLIGKIIALFINPSASCLFVLLVGYQHTLPAHLNCKSCSTRERKNYHLVGRQPHCIVIIIIIRPHQAYSSVCIVLGFSFQVWRKVYEYTSLVGTCVYCVPVVVSGVCKYPSGTKAHYFASLVLLVAEVIVCVCRWRRGVCGCVRVPDRDVGRRLRHRHAIMEQRASDIRVDTEKTLKY